MNTYEKIKMLRTQLRLSQDELAKLTGYTDRSSIAKIESGKVDLTESKIIALAKALSVSPSYLMGLSDSPAPAAPAAPALTSDEEQLVTDYRSLNAEGREKVSEYAADLVASGRYKKEPIVSTG